METFPLPRNAMLQAKIRGLVLWGAALLCVTFLLRNSIWQRQPQVCTSKHAFAQLPHSWLKTIYFFVDRLVRMGLSAVDGTRAGCLLAKTAGAALALVSTT